MEVINNYSEHLKSVKNISDTTYNAYYSDIKKFLEYCEKFNTKYDSVTKKFINQFLNDFESVGKTKATSMRALSSIKSFYSFLYGEQLISTNPTDGIRTEKIKRDFPEILSRSDLQKLFDSAILEGYKGKRDLAILELMYSTGIKVSELIKLKISDVNLQLGMLYTADRTIPIYSKTVSDLRDYLKLSRPLIASVDNDILFCNMKGESLSRQGIWKIIKHYADCAKIKTEITPETLRHTFVAHSIESGTDIKELKRILGQKNTDFAKRYIRFDSKQ